MTYHKGRSQHFLHTVLFQPMLLHLSWLETRYTRLLTASHLDSSLKKCLIFGRATTPDPVNISDTFSQREFAGALQHLKPGKTPGPDSICPELIIHAGADLKSWLRDFLSSCLCRLKIPKIWRRAIVVAISKPAKPVGDPKSYRPIPLLCVAYKILERLIYARVEPLIDPLLPKEQAGFRCGKSTVDQVVLLIQNIEDSFEAKKRPVPYLAI